MNSARVENLLFCFLHAFVKGTTTVHLKMNFKCIFYVRMGRELDISQQGIKNPKDEREQDYRYLLKKALKPLKMKM